MERDRLAREQEEKVKAEMLTKVKEQFGDANSQWQKDKSGIQNLVSQDKDKKKVEDKKPSGAGSKSSSEDVHVSQPAPKVATGDSSESRL
jgi:mannan polymerase II complex ANP1 subunit